MHSRRLRAAVGAPAAQHGIGSKLSLLVRVPLGKTRTIRRTVRSCIATRHSSSLSRLALASRCDPSEEGRSNDPLVVLRGALRPKSRPGLMLLRLRWEVLCLRPSGGMMTPSASESLASAACEKWSSDAEVTVSSSPLSRPSRGLSRKKASRTSACAASTRCSAIACVRMTILPSAAAVDVSEPRRPEPELIVEGRKL